MEKEMVQKFDLEAAFKALDEIETPKAKGLRANRANLKERFAAKTYGDELIEDYYNINDHEALEEAQEDREAEVAKAKLARIEKIVDLDAETEDDLLPSYVGKVIIQCPQCMTLFYKNPEDIEKSEENPDVVNINEVCQHCGNASGYTIIGKVGEVKPEEESNFEETTEESELNLDFGEPTEEVSPEGTGGGFEEFEETEVVEEGSDDSSDDELDLDAIDLEPAEESLKHEQLNEDLDNKIVAFLDCSGSWGPEKVETCEKRAHDEEGATKLWYFSDHIYDNAEEAMKKGSTAAGPEIIAYAEANPETKVVIYTDGDMEHQGGKALFDGSIPNVKVIRVDLGESLKEEVVKAEEVVEAPAEEILDAAAKAGEEVAEKAAEEELTKEEVKEITDEVVASELNIPVIEEGSDDSSDDELVEELSPSEIEQRLTAYAASLGVEESLEEKKDCDCKDGICECGDKAAADTPLTEGQYDVSDAEFKAMLQDKVFQEFGEDLKEEAITEGSISKAAVDKCVATISEIGTDKPVEEGIGSAISSVVDGVADGVKSLLASDEAEKKEIAEDINITNNDSPSRIDNRDQSAEETKVEDTTEGLISAVDSVVGGVAKGVDSLLASDEAEKKDMQECAKAEEGLGLFGVGDINVNLDASGQNNAVGVGGGEGKTESCHGEECKEECKDCKEEKHVCEKCGKEPCECKEEGLLPGLDILPIKLPGLNEAEDLHEESLNKHISDYLTEVYANVKDFKTTECSIKGEGLIVEGTINFNSGNSRKTKFEFTESKDIVEGKIILEGYNKDLAEDAHFTLTCLFEDGGNTLLTESFGYKYTINNTLVEGLK